VCRPHATELKLPHSTSPKPEEINDLPAAFDDLPPDFDNVDLDEAVPTMPASARPMAKVSRTKVKLRAIRSAPPPPPENKCKLHALRLPPPETKVGLGIRRPSSPPEGVVAARRLRQAKTRCGS
jgi:hypothetical protein